MTGAVRPVTPAEQYLRVFWAARLPFLSIVALFVAGAGAVTEFQPTLYTSQALLSIKPPPQVVSEALRNGKSVLGPDGKPYDTNDPDRQSGPGRYAPRLAAPGLVTLAARDAGIIGKDESLDARRAASWVSAERIEASDLIALLVTQPAPGAAQKLASAIVARGLEENRTEEALPPTRQVLDDELKRAAAAVDEAEQTVVREPASPSGTERDLRIERAKLELNLARERYAAVRKRMADIDLIVAERQRQLTLVDAPTLPVVPSFPRPAVNLSVGLALGVLAGTAFVALRSVFRSE